MSSRWFQVNPNGVLKCPLESMVNKDETYIRVTDSRIQVPTENVGQKNVLLYLDGNRKSSYIVDTFDEGKEIARYVLHGLKEKLKEEQEKMYDLPA